MIREKAVKAAKVASKAKYEPEIMTGPHLIQLLFLVRLLATLRTHHRGVPRPPGSLFTLAPRPNNSEMASICPLSTAHPRGVFPKATSLILAPYDKSMSIAPKWPFIEALHKW